MDGVATPESLSKIAWICAAAAACALAGQASASCGSIFCPVNTNWDVQGNPLPTGARIDLRYAYGEQKDLRSGTDKVSPDDVDLDEIEQETLNRNLFATFDYTLSQTWGLSVQAPLMDRSHSHVVSDSGEEESWQFDALGDVRVLARHRFAPGPAWTWGVGAGLKLPTASFDEANDEGAVAERSLQPGTGTTDAVVSVSGNRQALIHEHPSAWFVEAQAQHAFNERSGYEPGGQLVLDAGLTFGATPKLNLLVQTNVLFKEHDRGEEAEPEDTGGTFAFLSPGFAYAVNNDISFYAFLQVPLYQDVDGVQLTADTAFSLGFNYRFRAASGSAP